MLCLIRTKRMHLRGWWWMMDRDLKAWNVLSLCGLIMDRLDLNYWRMFYCINVMIWVWLMFGIAKKLWVNICRSVRGFTLVKARIHAGSAHQSSVYSMKYDIWSYSWIWLLLQNYVVCSVFWWLCLLVHSCRLLRAPTFTHFSAATGRDLQPPGSCTSRYVYQYVGASQQKAVTFSLPPRTMFSKFSYWILLKHNTII